MQQLMRDEFDVFRRQRGGKVDIEKIDYYLAMVRKQINMVKGLKELT